MERKPFRFEDEEYMLARMQPWWCYKDGGGDGGGVGPGTGRNRDNPAAGRSFGSNTSSGVSQGGGQRSTGNPNQPGTSTRSVRSTGNLNQPGARKATPGPKSRAKDASRGMDIAGLDALFGKPGNMNLDDEGLPIDVRDSSKYNQPAPAPAPAPATQQAPVESVDITAPPNTPQDQRQRTRGRRSTGNPNQPGVTRGVAVAPGAQDARNVPQSFLSSVLGQTLDDRQVNLNYDPFDTPDPAGGEHAMLEEEERRKKAAEEAQEQDETAAEAESESGIEAPAYPDGGGSPSSGSSPSSGMITATADAPTVASLLELINNQGAAATTPATGTEATPAYGLEDTRITKRPLTDPNLRTSALTNLGTRNMGTANPVVDPLTGSIYANPSAARSAGITNWVYKYVYDSKSSGSSLYSAVIG